MDTKLRARHITLAQQLANEVRCGDAARAQCLAYCGSPEARSVVAGDGWIHMDSTGSRDFRMEWRDSSDCPLDMWFTSLKNLVPLWTGTVPCPGCNGNPNYCNGHLLPPYECGDCSLTRGAICGCDDTGLVIQPSLHLVKCTVDVGWEIGHTRWCLPQCEPKYPNCQEHQAERRALEAVDRWCADPSEENRKACESSQGFNSVAWLQILNAIAGDDDWERRLQSALVSFALVIGEARVKEIVCETMIKRLTC